MKVRKGFVSNSSSSSFIVISDSTMVDFVTESGRFGKRTNEGEHLLFDQDSCHCQFGWKQTKYTSFEDKVSFSYLQANYSSNRENYVKMLGEVILEWTGASSVEFSFGTETYDAYIDHQSVGGDNLMMFEDKATLRDFLFSSNSYIQGDNDNH